MIDLAGENRHVLPSRLMGHLQSSQWLGLSHITIIIIIIFYLPNRMIEYCTQNNANYGMVDCQKSKTRPLVSQTTGVRRHVMRSRGRPNDVLA